MVRIAVLLLLLFAAGDARALVLVRTLDVGNAGVGALSGGAVDVAAGRDGALQFVIAAPDFAADPGDDATAARSLWHRRLTPFGVVLGEGRVDTSRDFDADPAVVALADAFGVVWDDQAVAGGITFRALPADGATFGPLRPVRRDEPDWAVDHAVAPVEDGLVVVWNGPGGLRGRRLAANGAILGPVFVVTATSAIPYFDVAAAPGIGFVVGWSEYQGVELKVRPYAPNGIPLGPERVVATDAHISQLAVDDGGHAAVVAMRLDPDQIGWTGTVLVQRFTAATGVPVGSEIPVVTTTDVAKPDLAFDLSGNFVVVWGRYAGGPPAGLQARAFAADGTPLGGAVPLHGGVVLDRVRTSRLPDGSFVNAFLDEGGVPSANLVSLCDPGSAVCGDGVLVSTCERCDDGAANSDTTPDACRTSCVLPRCGDGVVDGGESCDDGNLDACDGCSATCATEPGLTCGDGVVAPSGCGETCDDANGVAGDGCGADCALERIPGGGAPGTDCYATWRVDNPANAPLVDKHGAFRGSQTCVDGDARCDFDGGANGACTFHLAACANNVLGTACAAPTRLAAWTLERPSETHAQKSPALASVRAALVPAIPGAIVGPQTSDVCSPWRDVVVPLKGGPGAWRAAKMQLKTRADLYDGTRDSDVLKLICLPSP